MPTLCLLNTDIAASADTAVIGAAVGGALVGLLAIVIVVVIGVIKYRRGKTFPGMCYCTRTYILCVGSV